MALFYVKKKRTLKWVLMHLVNWFCVVAQVYKVSIGAACNLSWPADRLVIQVLDDSTDPAIKVTQNFGIDISLFFFLV